jgi:DUF3102 family protein
MSDLVKLPSWSEPESLDDAKSAIMNLGRSLSEYAYLIGKHLVWIKERVGHGKFLPWVKENLWFSEDTAERMMSFARRCQKAGDLVEYHPRQIPHGAESQESPSESEHAISELEAEISEIDQGVDVDLWDQAQRVVNLLEAGMPQRALAAQWINARTGEAYSWKHVQRVAKAWREYSDITPRPPFRYAYNEVGY